MEPALSRTLAQGVLLRERYETIELVGRGGMGATYRARDLRLEGRFCAVKEAIPDPDATPDELRQTREQFYREGLARFTAGTYAGAYEASLIAEFEQLLPSVPPWKRKRYKRQTQLATRGTTGTAYSRSPESEAALCARRASCGPCGFSAFWLSQGSR